MSLTVPPNVIAASKRLDAYRVMNASSFASDAFAVGFPITVFFMFLSVARSILRTVMMRASEEDPRSKC